MDRRTPKRQSPLVNLKNETEAASGRRFLELFGGTEIARPRTAVSEPVEEAKPPPGPPHHCSPAGRRVGWWVHCAI